MKSPLQKATLLLPQRLAQQGADLTASELTLAQTLGSNYPHALLESATALAAHTATAAEYQERARDVLAAVAAGIIVPGVWRRYALAEVAQAHGDLEQGRSQGAIILTP